MSCEWSSQLSDLLHRQLDELEALAACFPEHGALSYTEEELESLQQVRSFVEEARIPNVAEYIPTLSGRLRLPNSSLCGSPVCLFFQLPLSYPDVPPKFRIDCTAPRQQHEQLTNVVQQAVSEQAGSECLLVAVTALQEAVQIEMDQTMHDADLSTTAAGAHDNVCAPLCLVHVLVWFHHIKSEAKRKHIVSWGRELDVRGYCKPGFPGVIVGEGYEGDVEEYLRRLRSLKWQAMQVRAELREELPRNTAGSAHQGPAVGGTEAQAGGTQAGGQRRFTGPMQELGEGCLSELGALCRAAGLEELFLTALKVSRD